MPNLTITDQEYRSRRFSTYVEYMALRGQHPKAHAMGLLLLFWDASREMGLERCRPEQLGELVSAPAAVIECLGCALCHARYVHKDPEGLWVIDGNQAALARRETLRGFATKQRAGKKPKPKPKPKRVKEAQPQVWVQPDAAQAATEWRPSKAQPERTAFQQACHETWLAYAKAFEKRVARLPVRNQKVNSQIKQLVQRLGMQRAPIVARFYVEHANDKFYVQAMWSLDLLLRRAEAFDTQCSLGKVISGSMAQRASSELDYRERQKALLHESL
jgi:hypothetical protein